MQRHHRETFLRFQERRAKEDEAPRLRNQLPDLESLRLELDEYHGKEASPTTSYTRYVVVGRAAARFVIPCGSHECDGGHDLTRDFMRMLERSTPEFEGEDECFGERRGVTCHHRLHYRAHATYAA